MEILTREKLLNSDDLKETIVECPLWGGAVKVKALSLAKRNAIALGATDLTTGKMDLEKFQLLTFIECVVEPKFTIADYEALKNKSATMMEKVINVIFEISALQKPEEIKKN